jgi:hypothetical protein
LFTNHSAQPVSGKIIDGQNHVVTASLGKVATTFTIGSIKAAVRKVMKKSGHSQ